VHLIPAVIGAAAMLAQAGVAFGEATAVRPDQAEFRALYEELVETNTTLSEGSCTEAAAKMGARLKSAGFADTDLTYFADPAHPREGGLVAVLKGTDPRAGPILMIAHLDVVEARREDWTRDPFTLVEEGGFFYARGAFDDKAQAAIWTDSFIRIKRGDYRPKRTLKLALTCGEESVQAFNGVEWLVENRPELIAAEFALNEGGTGRLGADGRRESLVIQVSEKATQNYRIEATHPGGHSSRPVADNAIYELAAALERIRDHRFPVLLNDTTRIFLAAYARQAGGAQGEAIVRLLANPGDAEADRIASADPDLNRVLRTTCVATLLDGGHASNALPQRAGANLNCRIMPGETLEGTADALAAAIGNPKIRLTIVPPIRPLALSAPLDPRILGPAQKLADRYFPGMTVQPIMQAGYTDAVWLGTVNIPVYGVPGLFVEPDGNGMHGLNERVRVSMLYEGRDYLHDLLKAYATQ
jgi:acetylornithine deacetylase/succinyl-diaminopimelate desuccinylase-like protein